MQVAGSEMLRIYEITRQHNRRHFWTWEAEGRKSNFVLEIKHYVS